MGKCAEAFESMQCMGGIGKRNVKGGRMLGFCDEKELCVWQTHGFIRERKRKSLIA